MSDIVQRLRGWADADVKSLELFGQMMQEAADEIERLRVKDASFVGRLVRELYQSRGERGMQNVNIELCPAVNFNITVGPNPGDDELGYASLTVTFTRTSSEGREVQQVEFLSYEDELPARHLGEALLAWANWDEDQQRATIVAQSAAANLSPTSREAAGGDHE